MYCAWRIPAHLRCTQCSILLHLMDNGYLLSDMYLFMADITNPDFLVPSCRTWIGLDITSFCEQQHQPSSGSSWPACPKNGKSGTHCWGRGGSTQFALQLESAVTAPPLVGCFVWSIAPIAQSVSALDFNFKRAVECSILTAGKRLSLKIGM